MRKLRGAQPVRKEKGITANDISNILFKTSSIKPNKQEKSHAKTSYARELKHCEFTTRLMDEFTDLETEMELKAIKNGKAASVDGVLPKFLKFLGPKGINWLTRLAKTAAKTNNIPKLWRAAKVTAILKPGKPANKPSSYRPISLLSIVYNFFERLILNRIQHILENVLPIEQAGFRKSRACCDQVLALKTYIENGYQRKDKSGAVFLDLSFL